MRTQTLHALALTAFIASPIVACNKGQEGQSGPSASAKEQATTVTAEAKKEAEEIFSLRCTTCHGPQGKGDGPASAGLVPKPRNLQDKDWQKSVTDEHIDKIVQYGGAAVSKSPAMPPNPDLSSKPQVITALRLHVRHLVK